MNLLASFQHPAIHLVETHFTAGQKREAFDRLKSGNREGVVFKHTDAPYIAGRPASGGPQLKYKFCETASFIVGKVNAKRSVSLLLHAGKNITAAGNVTIPPNHEIPKPGKSWSAGISTRSRKAAASTSPCISGRVTTSRKRTARPRSSNSRRTKRQTRNEQFDKSVRDP